MLLDVTSFLIAKSAYSCPDFMLTVVLGNATLFNDMTNGMCYIPITLGTTPTTGLGLTVQGAPPGYNAINKTIVLT
jgi:hypothetical protein